MRCFCLWQKRCTCGAMCAFGTLRIAGRVRLQSSVRFIKTHGLPRITKTTAVAVVFWCTRGESKGAKRRNSVTKMLASKVKRQPEGSTAKQCAFLFKRTDSPYTKTTAVAVVFWCTRGESNPRHPASEAGALSN